MMNIDIRRLNAQKKYTGSMEFTYTPPDAFIDIPFVNIVGDVKIIFDYELYEDDSLEIQGKIFYRLEGQCSRCLEPAVQEIEGELNAYFQPCKDYEDYGYTNGVIHLENAVQDAIMASMPYVLLCKEDCEGIAWSDKTKK